MSSCVELTLTMARGFVPFELVGKETMLGPEDWAWQFLRLNLDYCQDYARAQKKQRSATDDPNRLPGRLAKPHAYREVLADEGICRSRYGLSTWIDPQCARLPKLERGESWFAPLSPFAIKAAPYEENFYVVTNGTFGRAEEHNIESIFSKRPRFKYANLFFLVDSSIPPAGQLLEIESFTRYIRKRLTKGICTAPPPYRMKRTAPSVEGFSEGLFISDQLRAPLAPGRHPSTIDLWSIVRLDFRSPLKANIQTIRDALVRRHEQLCFAGIAAEPPWNRFRYELYAPKASGSISLTDGHALKGYVVIAQLAQAAGENFSLAQIERTIGEQSRQSCAHDTPPPPLWDDWLAAREKRVAGYLQQAKKFIAGDYRWLVYAQKPDINVSSIKKSSLQDC